MSQPNTLGERLKAERVRLQLTQQELSAKAGVSKTTQVNYESGLRTPDAHYLVDMGRLGMDVMHLLYGASGPATGLPMLYRTGDEAVHLLGLAELHFVQEGPAPWRVMADASAPDETTHSGGDLHTADGPAAVGSALLPHTGAKAIRPLVLSLPAGRGDGSQQRVDYQVIPKHMRHASAGKGTIKSPGSGTPDQDLIDLAGDVVFSFHWMRRNLGQTTGELTTVQVQGDSMAATLLDGETIMIDQGITTIEMDGIYVLEVFGRRLVKRVQHLYDGTLVLISDNLAYQKETIPRDAARNVKVLGRMCWPRVR